MRPLRTTLCVLSFACALPTAGLGDDFSDFRIPAHRTGRLGMVVDGTFSRASRGFTGVAARSTEWRGDARASAAWRGDSDPREWDCAIDGLTFANAFRDAEDRIDPNVFGTFAQNSRSHGASVFEDWSLQAGTRLYPRARPVGFELRASLEGTENQRWSTSTDISEFPPQRDEFQRHEESWAYREEASLDAAIGLGRVRDATPVFQAILLEERLMRDRALVRAPSPAARQRLAELFALRGSFSLVHDLPDKYFWGEVERLLREDGALEGEAGASAWMHADEKLVVAGFFGRDCGFFVGPVLSARHVHQVLRTDLVTGDRVFSNGVPVFEDFTRISSRNVQAIAQTFYGVRAEYHRPLGDRSQADLEERALVDTKGEPDAFEVTGHLQLGRLIGERWFFSAFFEHERLLENRGVTADTWTLSSGGSIQLFLEDFLRVGLGVNQFRQHNRRGGFGLPFPSPPVPLVESDQRSLQVSLSLAVARGSLTAPGMGVRQTPRRH